MSERDNGFELPDGNLFGALSGRGPRSGTETRTSAAAGVPWPPVADSVPLPDTNMFAAAAPASTAVQAPVAPEAEYLITHEHPTATMELPTVGPDAPVGEAPPSVAPLDARLPAWAPARTAASTRRSARWLMVAAALLVVVACLAIALQSLGGGPRRVATADASRAATSPHRGGPGPAATPAGSASAPGPAANRSSSASPARSSEHRRARARVRRARAHQPAVHRAPRAARHRARAVGGRSRHSASRPSAAQPAPSPAAPQPVPSPAAAPSPVAQSAAEIPKTSRPSPAAGGSVTASHSGSSSAPAPGEQEFGFEH
jgi:hypothetical protein